MTQDRWQRIEGLFEAALERPASEREAFLEEACTGDSELRKEVAALIQAHEQAANFIEGPAIEAAAELLTSEPPEDSPEGRRLGPYLVIREIGHGGMGSVYLGVRADDQYQKRVAIKLVTPGPDSKEIVRRFRQERQILASLDHPNIAKLLDGGTTDDGLPYLVMDYIEGVPMDAYCDTHKLSTVERLKLFRTVCSAVQYAHQNLVVHRDLKPSNILVTADGAPKLLDFGIAKILNLDLAAQAAEPTVTRLPVMTPEYASPEQVRGEPITTASDVYSLGVVLYQLLTGHRPYRIRSHAPHDIAQAVCEQEPEKPSLSVVHGPWSAARDKGQRTTDDGQRTMKKLRRQFRGDLDNIVLMALRKEPQRRYTSVEQFSEDIRRHLEELPVIARKDTLAYRAGKFVKRHKAGVATAVFIALMLVGGIIAIAWQAHVADAERAKAERRFNEVRKLANSLVFQLHDQIADLPGSTPARNTLVRMALEYLDQLAREAGADPSLQQELALAYQKVGDVQGNPTNANLGDTAGAMESYRKALVIAEALVAAHPTDSQARRSLALIYERTSDLQAWTGNVPGAVESGRRALTLFQTLAQTDPTNLRARQSVAISHIKLGDILGNPNFPNIGTRAEALGHYRQSLTQWQALAVSDPTNTTTRRYLGVVHERIGTMQQSEENLAEALDSYRQSLEIRESFSATHPTNTDARRDLAIGYEKIADVLMLTGDAKSALEHQRQALARFEALSAADPNNANASRSLAISCEKVGDALLKLGEAVEGLRFYRRSLVIHEALSTADPTNVHLRRGLAGLYAKLGDTTARLASKPTTAAAQHKDRWREARAWYQRSLDIWLTLRSRGLLKETDTSELDRIGKEIANCDAALAK